MLHMHQIAEQISTRPRKRKCHHQRQPSRKSTFIAGGRSSLLRIAGGRSSFYGGGDDPPLVKTVQNCSSRGRDRANGPVSFRLNVWFETIKVVKSFVQTGSVLKGDHLRVGLLCGCVKFIHPAELDPMIERRRSKAASIHARAAGPEDHVRMGGDLLVSVGGRAWRRLLPRP